MVEKILKSLSDDLFSGLIDLDEMKIIFKNDQKRLELLNTTAPFFFSKLYEFYWNRLVMAASRLTDPIQSGKHKHISIYVLKEYSSILPDEDKKELSERFDEISKQAELVRQYRNKLISHRENQHIYQPINLEVIYVERFENIFKLIEICLNLFSRRLYNTTEGYVTDLVSFGAETLMYYLELGKKVDELKK